MNERQKTPQPDPNAFLLNQTKVNSTPQHHGTSEASSHLNLLTRAKVAPLIFQDLSKAASVEVDDMLRFFVAQIVLDKTKPIKDRMPEMKKYLDQIRKAVKPIVTASRSQGKTGKTGWGTPKYLHAQLTKFQKINSETEGYKPWVNFTNIALHLLKTKRVAGLCERNTEDDIIMQRTDPSILQHHHNGAVAGRKPDIAFLKLKRAQALHGTEDSWVEIAKGRAAAKPLPRAERHKEKHISGGPDDPGLPYFDWSDVLCFFEHKFTKVFPKSLSFAHLLVLEKLRAPVPPSPPGSSQNRKRSFDKVAGSSSGAGRSKSQKTSAGGTASSSSKNSQHISISHKIAKDAGFVPPAVPIVDQKDAFVVQAGEYGLGRLNSWFGATHSLGCLVLGSKLYICWFDREGLIGSSAIDVSKNLEEYLVLLFILQRFKDDEWGRLAALDDSTIHILDKAWKVDAGDILHKPWGIIGRNTTVIGCSQQPPTSSQPNASAPSIPASDVSPVYGMRSVDHLPKQRDGTPAHDNEPPIYDQTRPASHVAAEASIPSSSSAEDSIPSSSADESQTKEQAKKDEEEGHAGGVKKNLFVIKFSWVEKTRMREHEVYRKIEDVAQKDNNNNVKGHVPDLVAHRAFDGASTSVIRDALGVVTTRSRLLVAIVFKRLDGTIRDLSGAEYWKVYWETFLCHYVLWTQGVYHRDISDGNLMYRKDKDTGEVIGVLADFDLSSLQGNAISNTERTGTVPFMALDLLSDDALAGKVQHDYGHEIEAYFWVGVYDTACYDNGHTVRDPAPAKWNSLGANDMRKEKRDYLSSLHKHKHKPTPSQKDVWEGLCLLKEPLKDLQIFERPTEPNKNVLSARRLYSPTPQPFKPAVQEPKALRDLFVALKGLAEESFPSLLNRTSTSSS